MNEAVVPDVAVGDEIGEVIEKEIRPQPEPMFEEPSLIARFVRDDLFRVKIRRTLYEGRGP